MTFRKTKETRKKNISIGFLLEANKSRLRLTALTGSIGLNKEITDKNIHRPGLALAGYVQLFRYDRVQVFGNTEMRYLEQLDDAQREKALQTIFQFEMPCIVVTNDNKVDESFLRFATEREVAVLQSPFETTKFIYFLDRKSTRLNSSHIQKSRMPSSA